MYYCFCCPPPPLIVLELYSLLLYESSCPVFSVRNLSRIKVKQFFPVRRRAANCFTIFAYIIVFPWHCSPAGGGSSILFLSIYFLRQALDSLLLSGSSINWYIQTSRQFLQRDSICSRLCGRCRNIIQLYFQRVQHSIFELGCSLRIFMVFST